MSEFADAIRALYGFKTLKDNHRVIISDTDIETYANIGNFLSDESRVINSIRAVSDTLISMFLSKPADYMHERSSAFARRMQTQQENYLQGPPNLLVRLNGEKASDFAERKKKLSAVTNEYQKQALLFGEENDLAKNKADTLNNLFWPKSEHGETVIRKFRFRRLLRSLEYDKLGLEDKDSDLTTDKPINDYLLRGEVWRDSIGFDHGEYTHRLQWILAQHALNIDKVTIRRLYAGTSAGIKKDAYTAFGKKNARELDTATAAMAVPSTLWSFLFDAFGHQRGATKTWPKDKGEEGKFGPIAAYLHAGRSETCRAPAYLNKILLKDASCGIFHAYVTASAIKSYRIDLAAMNVSANLSKYRVKRQGENAGQIESSKKILALFQPE